MIPPTGRGTEDNSRTAENWLHFESMHEYASKQHIINPPKKWHNNPKYTKVVPSHSFTGTKECVQQYDDVQFLDEYQHLNQNISEPSNCNGKTSYSGETPTKSSEKQNTSKRAKTTSNSQGFESSTPSTSGIRRKNNNSEGLLKFFKKDAKRQKRENQHFFKLMAAFGRSKSVDMPEYDPVSSDSDEF